MSQQTTFGESQLAIIKPESIAMIVDAAPQAYHDNRTSVERCTAAGQALLDQVIANGMTDDYDQQIAQYIDKARKTVAKMNERRAPVTKLFDEVRSAFTSMENTIDPTKVGTIPHQLQQLRNQYAAKKRAEEEERRRAELARQKAEQIRANFRQECEDYLNRDFNKMLRNHIDNLTREFNNVTLETYDSVVESVKSAPVNFPGISARLGSHEFGIPLTMQQGEPDAIFEEVKQRLLPKFQEMYRSEMQDNKDYILDHLPSKRAELQRLAQADAEEAARIKAEIEERQQREAIAKEAERQQREAEERRRAEIERNATQMETLFNQQATVQTYQPKTKVAKKIELLNPEGILPVISMWWSKEGCTLSVEELAKIFKKQISFCEKLANKEEIFIEDESVAYIDEVKAQ